MCRTALAEDGIGRPFDVYTGRSMSRKARVPKDGDVGYAVIGGRVTVLVYDGRFQMWMPPGICIEMASRAVGLSVRAA